jgi:hypothetical protein
MIVPLANFVQLLGKWKDENAPIAGGFVSDSTLLEFVGTVGEVSEAAFSIVWESGGIAISLSDAILEYSDPREAPLEIKQSSEAKFVCCLSIRPSSGGMVALFELLREG